MKLLKETQGDFHKETRSLGSEPQETQKKPALAAHRLMMQSEFRTALQQFANCGEPIEHTSSSYPLGVHFKAIRWTPRIQPNQR